MPIAVRSDPGIAWARYPKSSIFLQTARTCSSVACARMTTNMTHLDVLKSIVIRISTANEADWSRYTYAVPISMAREQDILKLPPPKRTPRLTSRRIGIHTSSAGGVQNAAERAYRLGCNTFQVFSLRPRTWAPYDLSRPQCAE